MRWGRLRRRVADWLRRLAERIDVKHQGPEPDARFRLFRVVDGSRQVLYRGESPRDAVTVWEHHTKQCTTHKIPCHTLRGEYRFYDGQDCRGEVSR